MTTRKRVRRVSSVRGELLKKSREAALAAVQIFNNPSVTFKSETYIVLMIVAWTYLIHAYYRTRKVDYRYFTQGPKRKHYDRTKNGAFKHWELERCLNDARCPLAKEVVQNLKFLIGLRHDRVSDDHANRHLLSPPSLAASTNTIQSCSFLRRYIAGQLAVSLQFSSLSQMQIDTLEQHAGLPGHIKKYIEGFDGVLTPEEFASAKYAYRVIFVPKTANHLNQADQVITFVKADSEIAKTANATYAVIRETERPKWIPSQIVAKMRAEGFSKFGMTQHTDHWKSLDAKNIAKGYGVQVAKAWYWYDSWIEECRKHCTENAAAYR